MRPLPQETEPSYTARVVLPLARRVQAEVAKNGLVVRGDGGSPTRAVSFIGGFFYPDIEFAYFDTKCLAVEVKFIRDADPTGSISKALGQALVCRQGGFPEVHAILIDCRPGGSEDSLSTWEVSGVILHRVCPR